MCLTIRNYAKKHTATKNIVVYKVCRITRKDNEVKPKYRYRHLPDFRYVENKLYKDNFLMCLKKQFENKYAGTFEIHYAYHSFKSFVTASNTILGNYEALCIFEIPKGARYYVGVGGSEYASNRIKFIRKLKRKEVYEMLKKEKTK